MGRQNGDKEAREQFAAWRSHIPVFVNELRIMLAAESRHHLDFSPQSLDVVERFLLQQYPSFESIDSPDEGQRVNAIACYVGETYRHALNAQWEICLDPPDNVYYGLPVIAWSIEQVCPLSLTTACADRRTGTYLRSVLENLMEDSF